MFDKLLKAVKSMELEEQILHAGVLVCAIGVFLPWFGGQWFGKDQIWSGFGFYTSYIGLAVFLMQAFIIAMTLSPLLSGPVLVRRQQRNYVRLLLSAATMMLLGAAFTVLLRVTIDMSSAEIRWGMYVSVIGSAVSLLYAFMRYQEDIKSRVPEMFTHPDERGMKREKPLPEPENAPPPPPPPPPMPAENHHLFSPKQ